MPSVIEFPPPNLRGCFVAICAMGGTVFVMGAIALVLLLTGRGREGVALLAGWILCFPLGTAVFVYVYYVERMSRFLGRIEIQDDRITIRDDWRHQTIVVDSSTTFDWRSRSIVEGRRKYALHNSTVVRLTRRCCGERSVGLFRPISRRTGNCSRIADWCRGDCTSESFLRKRTFFAHGGHRPGRDSSSQ